MSAGHVEDQRQVIKTRPEDAETEAFAAIVSQERISADPVDMLCREFRSVCESAVDPLEIASALEFDGMNDAVAAARYGYFDVFALAEEMFRRVPRQPAEPPPQPDPWQVSKLTPILHGLLYGLPAIFFPAAGYLMIGPGVLTVLIISLVAAWSLSQGVAHLGYRRLGEADPGRVRRLLWASLATGVCLQVLAVTATAAIVHAHADVVMVGIGEGAYMLGASIMLVLGAERLLLFALAPGVLGSAAFLAAGRPPALERWAWLALGATPVLALVLAVITAGRRSRGPYTPPLITLAEIRGALPTAAFGLVAAGLLTFPAAESVFAHHGINIGALLAALPLSLSMGAAEWSLLWYRRRTQRLLRATAELQEFGRRARLLLSAALLQYMAGALVLIAAAATVAIRAKLVTFSWSILPELAVYLVLGCAMFIALLLQTMGDRAFALAAAAAALGAEVVFHDHGVLIEVMACAGLFCLLIVYAMQELSSTVRHGV